jgi:hypothetical protein
VFRADANLVQLIARRVLIPSGPLIASVAIGASGAVSESTVGVLVALAMVWFFCALILVPALLFKDDPSPGPSTDDGGGRHGPDEPPDSDPDPGGIPLPDAEQSQQRVRDHVRRRRPWLRRRTAQEPDPARRAPIGPD